MKIRIPFGILILVPTGLYIGYTARVFFDGDSTDLHLWRVVTAAANMCGMAVCAFVITRLRRATREAEAAEAGWRRSAEEAEAAGRSAHHVRMVYENAILTLPVPTQLGDYPWQIEPVHPAIEWEDSWPSARPPGTAYIP
jgi:hypothetical protein